MAVTWPVPVFAAAGADRWGEVQELRGCPDLRLVASPRHAAILLVAGGVSGAHVEPLRRVHDQLPHPRGAVLWNASSTVLTGAVRTVQGGVRELVEAVSSEWRVLVDDPAASRPDELVDRDPNEWRGIGPFGQGGEGMMGGTPYGRPMAMTGADRDGLALDQLHLQFGPFLDPLPGGVVVHVVLQGDTIQQAAVSVDDGAGLSDSGSARSGLQWLAHALHTHGLDAHAARAARLSCALATEAGDSTGRRDFERVRRSLRWTGLRASLTGVGRIDGHDAWDRWSARVDQIGAALEGRRDVPADDGVTLSEVGRSLVGAAWPDAVATIVSLDLLGRSVDGRVSS